MFEVEGCANVVNFATWRIK